MHGLQWFAPQPAPADPLLLALGVMLVVLRHQWVSKSQHHE